eukprot:IDg10436t1
MQWDRSVAHELLRFSEHCGNVCRFQRLSPTLLEAADVIGSTSLVVVPFIHKTRNPFLYMKSTFNRPMLPMTTASARRGSNITGTENAAFSIRGSPLLKMLSWEHNRR